MRENSYYIGSASRLVDRRVGQFNKSHFIPNAYSGTLFTYNGRIRKQLTKLLSRVENSRYIVRERACFLYHLRDHEVRANQPCRTGRGCE